VAYAVTSLTLTPVANDSAASITVNGTPVASGSASGSINLAEGVNSLTVTVTAEDGQTTQTYSLSVTRAAASSVDASLSGLTIDAANLDQSFLSGTTSYTASVAYAVTSLTLTPVATVSAASIMVNGTANASGDASGSINLAEGVNSLAEGVNSLTVTVTAEDGITTQTYSLAVTRAAASTVDASLAGLTIGGANLDLSFLSGTTTYTASVAYAVTSLTLTPIASVDAASITVNGTAVASGNASDSINLAEGVNSLTVIVTAEDGLATRTYRLSVTRTGDASLSGLTVNGADLEQIFQPNSASYTAITKYLTTTLTLIPVATVSAASITVNGSAVDSGSTSDPIRLAEGNNILTVTVTAEDGLGTQSYTLEVSRASVAEFAQQAYLKASNAGASDTFGSNVALDGDTMVVAAPREASSANGGEDDNSATYAGAVYVFKRENGIWQQQAYLKASNAQTGDMFGISVALDGDTLVVGAHHEDSSADAGEGDNSAMDSGAAYVFTRIGSTWSQQAYLKGSNTAIDDNFGSSVAVEGNTLVVSAENEASGDVGDEADNSQLGAGAVYVFTRIGTSWSQQAYLKASNAFSGGFFGASLALDGGTLAVGAYGEASSYVDNVAQADNNEQSSGAVYVFIQENDIWLQQAYLKASNAGSMDYFGFSVALDGDTLVAGAFKESGNVLDGELDNSASDSGAAYVFNRVGSSWSQQAYLKASIVGQGDYFGVSVALDGDTIVVGAKYEDSSALGGEGDNSLEGAGAAYLFFRAGTSWSQQAYLKASSAGSGDNFGHSVALDGETVLIGAKEEASSALGGEPDDSAVGAGAVYFWQ
jgi:hypothetical protein